jgi:hypothetical protein
MTTDKDDRRARLFGELTLEVEAVRILARQIQDQAGRLVGTSKSQELWSGSEANHFGPRLCSEN